MRALRRLHRERAKQRAVWRLRRLFGYAESWLTPRAIGRKAATRVGCSCRMCGNPRTHWGEVTWQERKMDTTGG